MYVMVLRHRDRRRRRSRRPACWRGPHRWSGRAVKTVGVMALAQSVALASAPASAAFCVSRRATMPRPPSNTNAPARSENGHHQHDEDRADAAIIVAGSSAASHGSCRCDRPRAEWDERDREGVGGGEGDRGVARRVPRRAGHDAGGGHPRRIGRCAAERERACGVSGSARDVDLPAEEQAELTQWPPDKANRKGKTSTNSRAATPRSLDSSWARREFRMMLALSGVGQLVLPHPPTRGLRGRTDRSARSAWSVHRPVAKVIATPTATRPATSTYSMATTPSSSVASTVWGVNFSTRFFTVMYSLLDPDPRRSRRAPRTVKTATQARNHQI